MSNQDKPLSAPRMVFDEDNPFNGDLLNRRDYTNKLTGYINRLRDGSVLAIDAPWGEGKTWIGKNWAAELKSTNRVIYMDAFQQDYVEDPFLLIVSEINLALGSDKDTSDKLIKNASNVMKAILPIWTKALINIAGRVILGNSDISNELKDGIESINDELSDSAQKWVQNKIESYKEEKDSIENFKNSLKEFCVSQENPVVFFIDELDRCRPDFAVKLIERIKHFFDVPNLVFILLINRDQLEKAIKGVYGIETDASTYLSKFIHLYLNLPREDDLSNLNSTRSTKYLRSLAKHYKFEAHQELEYFIQAFSIFASTTKLSLRDLERAMALIAFNGVDNATSYLAWLIFIKVKYPEIYNGLINNDKDAHIKAIKILEHLHTIENSKFWVTEYFLAVHTVIVHGKDELTEEQNRDFSQHKYSSLPPEKEMQIMIKKLDFLVGK